MPQHVTVEKFNIMWEKQFVIEKELIKAILGSNLVKVYHIGSTSVNGLSAKPIIDIMPVVQDLSAVDLVAAEFEKIGYKYMGEFGIKGRRYLRKGGDERTHQIHIFQIDDKQNIGRHLAVRDYLRTHADQAKCYGQLKEQLANKFPYDIEGYCDGKDDFMKKLEQSAIAWYGNTIRKADVCDVEEIMQIWKAENIRAHNFISPSYWENNFCVVKNALPQAEIYLATCESKVIGFVGLSGNYIEGIFIKLNHQHKGIGSALLKKVKTLHSTLTLNVYKKNVNAISFYLKNGFAIVNEGIDKSTNEGEYTMQWKDSLIR